MIDVFEAARRMAYQARKDRDTTPPMRRKSFRRLAAKSPDRAMDGWAQGWRDALAELQPPGSLFDRARTLGRKAHAAGLAPTPAADPGLKPLLTEGVSDSLDGWLRGWHEAHSAAPVE